MSWKIDPAYSSIQFSVQAMNLNLVRGRFSCFTGHLDLDPGQMTAAQVRGEINVASIDTDHETRDAHLLSVDFFDVEQFPTIGFRSTHVERLSLGQYRVCGDLTIKSITRPVTFDVVDHGRVHDPWGAYRWGFSAESAIKRQDFGLCWNIALAAGGWVVGERVKIKAEIQLIAG
ncbi:MAG TPA: YceI family protein [Anaerolineae bacterium]|nr:YceI family protein [Anaerolineae bacterium]HMR66751.1 YceI family protein [Anaerolineae bacterium]